MFGGYSSFAGAILDGFVKKKDFAGRFIPRVLWPSATASSISIAAGMWVVENAIRRRATKGAFDLSGFDGRRAFPAAVS